MHLETFEDDEIAKARKLVGKELQNGTYLPDLISPVFIWIILRGWLPIFHYRVLLNRRRRSRTLFGRTWRVVVDCIRTVHRVEWANYHKRGCQQCRGKLKLPFWFVSTSIGNAPSCCTFVSTQHTSPKLQLIGWARINFENVRAQMGKDAKRAKKMEEKLTIWTKVCAKKMGEGVLLVLRNFSLFVWKWKQCRGMWIAMAPCGARPRTHTLHCLIRPFSSRVLNCCKPWRRVPSPRDCEWW